MEQASRLISIMVTIFRYLDGDDLMFDYDPAVISEYTMALTRDKMNIFLRSKEIPAEQLDQVPQKNLKNIQITINTITDRELVWDPLLLL